MNIDKKITITLREEDVKTIVAQYLTKEGYSVSPDGVTLDVEITWVGYGLDEHQVARFKNCTAVVKGK